MNDVLAITERSTSEITEVLNALRRETSDRVRLRDVSTLAAGFSAIAETPPDLAIVLQTWPEEFARAQVDRLLAAAPLARWIVGVGPWCESIGRTRDTWPVAVRVPLPLVPWRVKRELAVLRGERPAVPLTASRDETFAADVAEGIAIAGQAEPIAVVSPDRHLRDAWRDLLTAAGFGIESGEAVPAAVVFDADPWNDVVRVRLGSLVETGAAVVAVTELPTAARRRELREGGVAAVVPKLAPADVLIAALRAAIDHSPDSPSAASAG